MAAVDKQAGVDHICRSKEDSQSQSMRTKYLILRQDGGSSSCLIYVSRSRYLIYFQVKPYLLKRLRRTINGKGAADARPEIEPATNKNLKF